MSHPQDIILLYYESLRPDMLLRADRGFFSDFLDRGVFFSHVRSASPSTRPALHALFSGQYPAANGLIGEQSRPEAFRSRRFPPLAQLLAENGYQTLGYASGLGGYTVPDQGFDFLTTDREAFFRAFEKRRSPFFAFYHVAELWTWLEGARRKNGRNPDAQESDALLAHGGTRDFEVTMKRFLEEEGALLCTFSDACFEYPEESAPVSFLSEGRIKGFAHFSRIDEIRERRVDHAVRSVDLHATLCSALGLATSPRGDDLLGDLPSGRECVACSESPPLSGAVGPFDYSEAWTVKVGPWKYGRHRSSAQALVHLGRDPLERHNLLKENGMEDHAEILDAVLRAEIFGGRAFPEGPLKSSVTSQ